MNRALATIAGLTVLALAAPATAGPKKDPQVEAAMERLAALPVTCSGADDCSRKWDKAVAWVSSNSAFKIQLATDNLIQTFGPSTVLHGTAFVVNKVPAGDGYTFQLQVLCRSQPFCGLSARDYRAMFAAAVMTPDPAI